MKHQGEAVHAVAQAGWLRSIVEHMTEMTAAAAAVNFGPRHPKGPVFGLADGVFQRLVKTRPAGAALEFRLRGEQRQVAAGAGEDTLAMLLEQRARSRAFGALLAQDVVLLRRQLRAPFRIGLFDLEFFGSLCRGASQPAEGDKAQQAGDRCEQDAAVDHDGLRAKRMRAFAVRYGALTQKLHRSRRNFLTFLRAIVPRTPQHSALRCAAEPGPMPVDWVPALRCTVRTLHRVRDTRRFAFAGVCLGRRLRTLRTRMSRRRAARRRSSRSRLPVGFH